MERTSHFHAYDDIISSLDQIDALISIAMNANITECDPKTAFNYFLAISNIVANAKMGCLG